LDDLDALVKLRSDDEVVKYLGGDRVKTREYNEQRLHFYLDSYKKIGVGMCAIIWKETGEMIGTSGLQPLGETGEIEVGYALIKKYWRHGIGFEVAQAWLDYGFNQMNLPKIVAIAHPDNTGSRRIMEKCGMKYEKTEAHYGILCVFYAITREEFKAQQ
jgi:ribosomal-protein-alanine N-acetyltransferase